MGIRVAILKQDDESDVIGQLELDIGTDFEIVASNPSDSRLELAEWRALKSLKMDKPELLCSLLAEYYPNIEAGGSEVGSGNSMRTSPVGPIFPVLNEEAGHFLLGEDDIATEMFYYTIIIHSVLGISQAWGQLYISYSLFGNKVRTDPFEDSALFSQEMATAKILSNLDTVVQYFSQMEPLVISLRSEETGVCVAQCQDDFAIAFRDPDRVQEARSVLEQDGFEFRTVLNATNCLDGNNGQVMKPQIMVTIRLGRTPPDYEATEMDSLE